MIDLNIIIILLTCLFAFGTTLAFLPNWIVRAKKAGLVGVDKHKRYGNKIAEVGGIPVISGFLIAILFFVAVQVFILKEDLSNIVNHLAVIVSILIALIIGFVDDILGWKIGLRIRYKVALTFLIALPIVVINSGVSKMNIPLVGIVDFGLIYPLVIIPLAIIGTSNAFNMIAGFNGLEAGMGIIILFFLGLISAFLGNIGVAVLAFAMVASLIAFFIFNKNPAKVFPGDSLTYGVGALIGIIAIVGNIEKTALFMFALYFIEFVLKAKGKMKKESFAKLDEQGFLLQPYDKIYGIEHIMIRFYSKFKERVTENMVTYSILALQFTISSVVFVMFLFEGGFF